MSHEKNFVSELVQMARAFEELPQVQADLMSAKNEIATKADTIQRLELRLIDAKNELDAAHAATAKAEVERDHAETMFLETDQKLDSLRSIFYGFQTQVVAFDKASEPEPVAPGPSESPLPVATEDSSQTVDSTKETTAAPTTSIESGPLDSGQPVQTSEPAPVTNTDTQSGTTSQGEVGSSGSTGESANPLSQSVPMTEETSVIGADPSAVASTSQASMIDLGQSEPDPTAAAQSSESGTAAASPTVETIGNASQQPMTDSSTPQDDVGYHNEPDIATNAWTSWFDRMTARYGSRQHWPERDWTVTSPINSQT